MRRENYDAVVATDVDLRAIGCVLFPIGLLWVVVDRQRVGVAHASVHLDAVDDVAGASRHGLSNGAGCAGEGDNANCARRQQESTG
jgi:hypothetical protein